MEKLEFRLQSSQAKSIGTILSVAGELIVTLYKGQLIIANVASQIDEQLLLLSSNWVSGGIFCAVGALCLASLYIVQTWILKEYPTELMVTLISCIFVTLLSAVVSLIVEKDSNAWILKPDVELTAILCSAIFAVSLRSVVHAWACRKKGPL
ncbi:hypothetical protein JCGZ_02937 [Jatropha curcas]|uniref:Uncharacterized protein n=1 Tax=Jatropha curcas TaxID=180498 RepID=A0A067L1D7_JATCU|nr:hypothetical protein JCGZ_02937 [Jatropha curcas]